MRGNFSLVTEVLPVHNTDDTTLFSTLEDINLHNGCSISQRINNDISRILEWLHVNKLCLNAIKSNLMLFHSPNKIIAIPAIEIKWHKSRLRRQFILTF